MANVRQASGRLSVSRLSMFSMIVVAVAVAVTVLFVYSPAGNGANVGLQLVAQGFNSPVHLESPPDGSGRRFIVDRIGTVHVLTPDGQLLDEPFLDVRDRMVTLSTNYDERGLLGFTFHPQFAANGRIFAHYSAPLRHSAPTGWNHTGRIVEFVVSASDPNRADITSERVIIEVDQPQPNHNGGVIAFGPDGYLYIGLGDGGGGNDVGVGHPPLGNGQDVTTLLGSVLRIDVDSDSTTGSGANYAVPRDNPFADGGGRPEIYAWGFRNPYRFSFDRGGERHLFVADVGQNVWEEVNMVTRPGNFGWRIKEGSFWFDPERPDAVTTDGPNTGPRGEPLIDPIVQYRHPGGRTTAEAESDLTSADPSLIPQFGISVIGGYVYRGEALPEWHGHYVFGDWSTSFGRGAGKLLLASPPAARGDGWTVRQVSGIASFVLGFGEDAQGELYVLTTDRTGPSGQTGKVYKLAPVAE